MRLRLSVAVGLCVGIALALFVAVPVAAQPANPKPQVEAKGKAAKVDRLDGTIRAVDQKAKAIVVRARGMTLERQVIYDDKTKFTFRNKPSSLDEVKDGRRVICLGHYDDKGHLIATRIDVRNTM
jgi:hypothetical protein